MTLCDEGHEEVCYEERSCPFCDFIADTTDEIKRLHAEIRDLEKQLEEAE